jgi:hypothetical protein
MQQRERILLIRSGRHLAVACKALETLNPKCEISVLGTRGSERAIEQVGIPPERTYIYDRQPRLTPIAFVTSATGLGVIGRFDRVAVLWNDPDGRGQGNVDRTAFAISPRGFLAITPDGSVIERSWMPVVRFELKRTATSLATALVLGALYLPALLLPGRRS